MEYVVYFLLGFFMARDSGSSVEGVSSFDLQPLMDALIVVLPVALLVLVVTFGIVSFLKFWHNRR